MPDDAVGPFGPGAIGISAFSEVLTGWTQGGPIAIHGTNRPDLLGRAVSNGCIRVRNDLLRQLFDRTLAGTPVTVRALTGYDRAAWRRHSRKTSSPASPDLATRR